MKPNMDEMLPVSNNYCIIANGSESCSTKSIQCVQVPVFQHGQLRDVQIIILQYSSVM